MLKKVVLGLVAVVVLFAVVVALQPADYRVARSITIAAGAPEVFAQVNDFHNWDAWSPWTTLDPGMKKAFEGAPSGVGAVYAWSGNDKVGEGRMTLTESTPPSLVRARLDFVKPFPSTSNTEFALEPEGNATKVTWTMSGHNSYIEKAFCLFMDMDKMIGGDFERGLLRLKSTAESGVKK